MSEVVSAITSVKERFWPVNRRMVLETFYIMHHYIIARAFSASLIMLIANIRQASKMYEVLIRIYND